MSSMPTRSRYTSTVAWFAVGSALLALAQWLVFVIVNALFGVSGAGDYAVALAAVSPWFILFGSGLRLVQLTEEGPGRLRRHVELRLLATAAATAGALAQWGLGFGGSIGLALLVAVAASRAVDLLADAFYAEYQIGMVGLRYVSSALVRSVAAALAVVAISELGGPLPGAVLAGAGVSALAWALLDLRPARAVARRPSDAAVRSTTHHRRAIRDGALLGAASSLALLTLTIPRLVLDDQSGPADAARFTALTILFVAVSFVTNAAGQTAIPRLAHHAHVGDRRAFSRLLGALLGLGVLLGLLAAGLALTIGPALVEAVFGEAYADLGVPLLVLSAALGCSSVTTFLQDGLTALGVRAYQVVLFGLPALLVLAVSVPLVGDRGIDGAAYAVLLGTALQLLLAACGVVVSVTRSLGRRGAVPVGVRT